MCGRTACALDPASIRKACTYRDNNTGKYKQPEWKESKAGLEYRPSLNIAPTEVTPVLVNASQLDYRESEPVIYPMVWGMVPPWHKGEDFKSHGLSTNNCRIENIKTSKLYSPALSRGQRCVVLCEGFYEWQTTKKEATAKQPYYIYAPQAEGVRIENPQCWESEWSEDDGWKGPKLLRMAGLYSCWHSPEGKPIYSYSVITMESNKTMSWLHHRMPAILSTDAEVLDWLDNGRVPPGKAIDLLKPKDELAWHPVSNAVNNSRNKTDQCNKPVELGKPKPSPGSALMRNWLKMGSLTKAESKISVTQESDVKPDISLKREKEESVSDSSPSQEEKKIKLEKN